MSVKIGDLEFPSKKEATDYTRSILDEVGRGVSIYPSHPRFKFFNDLLNNHSDRPRKEGPGIASFGIQRNARDGRFHETYIIRTDGTKETFSWRDCAGQPILTPEKQLIKAYRCAIDPQIDEFRKNPNYKCVICNSREFLTVDHKHPTFFVLVKKFEAQVSLPLPTTFDKDPKTHAQIFTAADKSFQDAWLKYHKDNATLQLLCKVCHKTKTVDDNRQNAEYEKAHQSSEIAQPDKATSVTLG